MHLSHLSARFRAAPSLLFIVLFLISLPAVTVRFYASDEIEYFAYLRSMWFDGDLSFDNEYRYFYDRGIARGWRFKETFLDGETPTGLRFNFAPIGSAILWSPSYIVTDAGVRAARAVGSDVEADGYSTPYIASVVYASALYGFLAIALSAYAATQIVGSREAAAMAALAVWLGTPVLFYMYLAPGFSHACSAFAVAAFVVIWLRIRHQWSFPGVVVLGIAAAVMGMVREQDVFIAIGPALDFLLSARRQVRAGALRLTGAAARAVAGTVAFALCFLPQVLTYATLFGRGAPSSTVQNKMAWTSPHTWQVLASPANGLLFWTPLALPALAGLVWMAIQWKRIETPGGMPSGERRYIAAICLIMVMTQIYVGGALDTWAGAGSFGQRRLVGLTIFFVLGLTTVFAALHRRSARVGASVLVVLAVWWNVGLIAQFGAGMMNRQRLEPMRNAYHNFVTIPRQLPTLVYRFLVDRASFYQRHPPP
jgi:energy-converting hydrogenase Eha subunit B